MLFPFLFTSLVAITIASGGALLIDSSFLASSGGIVIDEKTQITLGAWFSGIILVLGASWKLSSRLGEIVTELRVESERRRSMEQRIEKLEEKNEARRERERK